MTTAPAPSHAIAWRRAALALALCLAWILYWYRDTAVAMVGIWGRSETFTHGYIVPPIVLWLIWRLRGTLARLEPRPSPWVGLLIAGSGFAWLLGDLASVNAVTQLALVATLVLAVPAILGAHVARVMIFPLGFLFFAVPIGEFALPRLMDWTAEFTVIALRLSGIPVYQEGLQFVIPSGNWSVVEACSGVRYLIASLTTGTLFAYLNYSSLRRRLIFVGVSILVPIVANWLRAYLIVLLGHVSGNKLAAGVDHLIYGWVFFGIVIMIMFVIGARWAEAPAGAEAITPLPRPRGLASLPAGLVAVAVAGLAWLPHGANRWIAGNDQVSAPKLAIADTGTLAGWAPAQPFSTWRPAFINPSAELRQTFERDGQRVGLYIAYYRNQSYEHKLVSSENVLVKSLDKEWVKVASGARDLAIDGNGVSIRTTELRSLADRRLVVWQWYWINGRLTASDHLAKAYTAISRLSGQGDDAAVIIVHAPKDGGQPPDAVLESFVRTTGGGIDRLLAQARDQR